MGYAINTDIADFSELIAPHVPFCPDFMRQRAIRDALIQFCRETRSWRETVPEMSLSPGDSEIDANVVAGYISRQAVALEVNDIFLSETSAPLRKRSREELDRNVSGWQADTSDTPTGYFMSPQRVIRFYPAMNATADEVLLDIEVVLSPTLAIETLPDYIYNFHSEAISNAAIWRLLTQPEMPWTDLKRAAFFVSRGKSGMSESRDAQAKRAVDAINAKNRRHFR